MMKRKCLEYIGLGHLLPETSPAGEAVMMQRDDEPLPASQTECVVCGYVMEGYQCNLVCPNCGYREDCSDAFRAGPLEQPAEDRERDSKEQDKRQGSRNDRGD